MKSWLCELILSCTVAAPGAPAVEDLYYGTVLYAYYQEEYQDGLVEALVAETRNRRGADPLRLELAKGSFAFADGMFDYAASTFASIDPAALTELDRQRLAFHLAREHFRRGDWARVEEQLSIIDLGKTWFGRERRHPEVEFMRAELAIQRGDFAAAEALLQHVPPENRLRAYLLFNLGVALRAAGEHARAAAAFAELAETDVYDSEALDLKERARLALSFVKRELTETAGAGEILRDLPAAGRYRDLALTSYGGLAMDTGDYELAARVWASLKEQSYWTPSTAAARLAFPLSLEQLASRQAALIQYRVAEASFEARLTNLDALAQRAEDSSWVHDMLRVFSATGEDAAAAREAMDEWRAQLGHTDWLEWLAEENVHELMLEWRELDETMTWLERLPEELATFDQLATEQRRRAERARELISTSGLAERREQAAVALATLDARIAGAKARNPARERDWMDIFATAEEQKVLDRLAEVRAALANPSDPGAAQLAARVARLEGLVFWQIVEDAANRLRALELERRELAALIDDVDSRIARVRHAEERFVAGVQTDFLALQTRADSIADMVRSARASRETMLAKELRAGMARERDQLERYLLLTRIAIARAMDQIALNSDQSRLPAEVP